MKRCLLIAAAVSLLSIATSQAGLLEDVTKGLGLQEQSSSLDDATIAKGLKEALAVGTERAVTAVSKPDGFFGNQLIKILMPEKIQNVANLLGKMGFQSQVDEFVLSMNTAAEKAAPKAASYFADAIREMTIADARKILQGGNTAATEYLRQKTGTKIQNSFKPAVTKSLNEVGATRSYNQLMETYATVPFAPRESLDLDTYVTGKAVDGLFLMLGVEEKKIRTDPAARATELLKNVFGSTPR